MGNPSYMQTDLLTDMVYASRPNLSDQPSEDPELELFTDDSSFNGSGKRDMQNTRW